MHLAVTFNLADLNFTPEFSFTFYFSFGNICEADVPAKGSLHLLQNLSPRI